MGTCQQGLLGRPPTNSIPQGNVADGRIGQDSFSDNENVICRSPLGKCPIQTGAVAIFVRIVGLIILHQLEGMDRSYAIGIVGDLQDLVGIRYMAFGAHLMGGCFQIILQMKFVTFSQTALARPIHPFIMQVQAKGLARFDMNGFNK